MSATSRELVWQTLRFESPARAPRQLWHLPWAEKRFPEALQAIRARYPADINGAPGFHSETPPTKGNATEVGIYSDEFGCEFTNIHEGVIGEVKNPIIRSWQEDASRVRFPRELLTIDADKVNAWCATRSDFITAGCCPRPFERLQFLRGTADFYIDLMTRPPGMDAFIKELHAFNCALLELWAKTDVDALSFMDDWGSQKALLIAPQLWREIFKPMYRDFIQIAHGADKAIFMHTDGYTVDIFPDMIELGLDAINAQIFCMGVEKLRPFAGKITFWGEIDRQHILSEGTAQDAEAAVLSVYENLWRNGGCIAQCEFGPGGNPEAVAAVFAAWDRLTAQTGPKAGGAPQ